jgi:hypothetical protein
LIEKTDEEIYEEKISSLSDIELLREQSENFVEIMFFQIKLEEVRKQQEIGKEADFENSTNKVKQRIRAVRDEIERRDREISSRISFLHRAIDEAHSILLCAETLKQLSKVNFSPNSKTNRYSEDMTPILDRIIESAKENVRLVKAFAQMNLKKDSWMESKIADRLI